MKHAPAARRGPALLLFESQAAARRSREPFILCFFSILCFLWDL
jgi:hypothetical protein